MSFIIHHISAILQYMNTTLNTSRFTRTAIIVAIVIVMNLFFNYTVSLVYSEPTYDQFVPSLQIVEQPATKESCVLVGGQWNENIYPEKETKVRGWCDPNYTNQKKYESARKVYDRNVFVTLVVLGVVSLIAGGFVALSILSLSFSWGGVLSLVIASMRYWTSADKILKVVILAVALGTLIWLAVKKFSK